MELARAPKGSVVVLVPDPEQATWLNTERPILANRDLKVILFSHEDTSAVLARKAPDFFNWISHRVECPDGVPLHAVRGIQAALRFRAPGVVWRGGDFEKVFRAALPGRELVIASAAIPYEEMVEVSRPRGRGWVAWTDVDGPFRAQRVFWAAGEAGRRARVVLLNPDVRINQIAEAEATQMSVSEGRKKLEEGGATHPGRLAALLGLEPDAIVLAASLLHRGELDETAMTRAARGADDPGIALAGAVPELTEDAIPRNIAVRMRSRWSGSGGHRRDFFGRPSEAATVWFNAAHEAGVRMDFPVVRRWALRGLQLDGESVLGLELLGRAIRYLENAASAEPFLRRAVALAERKGTVDEAYASALNALVGVLSETGQLDEAEELAGRLVEVAESHFGQRPAIVADARCRQANIAWQRGDSLKGIRHMQDALGIVAKDESLEGTLVHVTLLVDLGAHLVENDQHMEAEGPLRRALDLVSPSPFRGSALHANALYWLGVALFSLGHVDHAEASLTAALAIARRADLFDRQVDAGIRRALASCEAARGAFDAAEAHLLEARGIASGMVGPGIESLRSMIEAQLARLYEQRGEISRSRRTLGDLDEAASPGERTRFVSSG